MMVIKKKFWSEVRRQILKRPNILYPLAFGDVVKNSSLVPTSITIQLRRDSSIGKKGDVIQLPFDGSTLATLFVRGDWHDETIKLLEEGADNSVSHVVIDIGANVGLFSRQMLHSKVNISSLICVEPDSENFSFLAKNLAAYTQEFVISMRDYALAEKTGTSAFFKDVTNIGNFSLNPSAVEESNRDRTIVKTKSVEEFFNEENLNQRLIIKLDTQGYDEFLVTLVPEAVWDKVDALVMEIWALEGKKYDKEKLEKVTQKFTHLYLGGKKIDDIEEIFRLSLSTSRAFKDLVCIK